MVLAGAVAYIRNNREITGSLVALPKGEWAAVDRDGLSYTASAGADDYLKLTKDDEVRPVDLSFKRTFFRSGGLDLK